MRPLLAAALIAMLSGCAVVTVVDTAASVTATAVETTVDVTAGVARGAVDLVTGDDDEDEAVED